MIGYVLLGIGTMVLLFGVINFIRNKIQKTKTVVKERDGIEIERSVNTDKSPPNGFSAHYELIMKTAPTAAPSTREMYALGSMSESDILVAERQRLEDLVANKKETEEMV